MPTDARSSEFFTDFSDITVGVMRSISRVATRAFLGTSFALFCVWLTPYNFLWKIRFLRYISDSTLSARLHVLSPLVLLIVGYRTLKLWRETAGGEDRRRNFAGTTLTDFYESFMSVLSVLFLQRAFHLVRNNVDQLIDIETHAQEREALAFSPPPKSALQVATAVYRSICEPVFLGLENVPSASPPASGSEPILFVSNHSILALELPLLLEGLYSRKNLWLRALADHAHFQIPVSGSILRNIFGCVDGTRRNVELLFAKKQAVLVYPGGARETFKRTTDRKYELKWSDRDGFARLAIEHSVTIVPVSNVGTEDMVDIFFDLPLGYLPIPFLYGSDRTFPLLAPSGISDIQRIYFLFGRPIRTAQYGGVASEENVMRVRNLTKRAVEDGIARLRHLRERDASRFAVARVSRATVKRAKKLAEWVRATGRKHSDGNGTGALRSETSLL